ncbi:MAG: response regulator [Elusimicrobia bacterium]|nr:response regulator [Elusimicrobiota bacterium]
MDMMIFDDDPYAAELIATIAEDEGLTVEKHLDGIDALEKIRCGRPRLVVTDIMMPGIDGISLCRAVRADPALASIHVVVCSGKQFEEDRQRALAAGAAAYFTKPLEMARLRETMARLLPRSSLAVPGLAPVGGAPAPAFRAKVWGCRNAGTEAASHCVCVEFGSRLLILDAGTGLAGATAGPPPQDRQLWLLLSRHHSDNMTGFPALAPWLRQGCVFRVAGPGDMTEVGFIFVRCLPGTSAAQAQFYQLSEGPFQLWPDVALTALLANHPGATMAFRLDHRGRSLVYCPANELEDPDDVQTDFNEKMARFARGADVLLHDARYSDEDFAHRPDRGPAGAALPADLSTAGAQARPGREFQGHSCPSLAVDLALKSGARRLVLFQLDARYGPAEVDGIVRASRDRLRESRSTLRLDAAEAGQVLEV